MTESSGDYLPKDARTMAAVMAAVQAYLDDESSPATSGATLRLSPWKMAPWQALRDDRHLLTGNWRNLG